MSEKDRFQCVMPPSLSGASAQSSACGKAIIVGEHAVVYGSHAVAMPLKQMRMNLELTPQKTHSHQLSYQLRLSGNDVSDRVAGVIPEALKLLQLDEPMSLSFKGQSSLPIGAGLGSSATLCVAILRALSESYGLCLSKTVLAELGNQLEARFHGNPSGLDTAAVAFEECIYFAKGHPIEGFQPKPGWHFALIDSKIRASTLSMIRLAQPFFSGSQGEHRIAQFDRCADQVKQALVVGDHLQVAESMSETGALLKQAGIVPSSIEDMLDQCLEQGALAAKTTGAGGGGTILCLLDPSRWNEQYLQLKAAFADFCVFHVSI